MRPPNCRLKIADRSTLLEQTFVQNLPLDPRNPLQLISATIGVTANDGQVTSGTNTTTESTTNQFRINGAHLATTDMLIDGGANMVAYNSQAAGVPGVDAIAEFRVLTSAIAPEYGYTSGGIVNMALKSGANKIHGGAWEYFPQRPDGRQRLQCQQRESRAPAFAEKSVWRPIWWSNNYSQVLSWT